MPMIPERPYTWVCDCSQPRRYSRALIPFCPECGAVAPSDREALHNAAEFEQHLLFSAQEMEDLKDESFARGVLAGLQLITGSQMLSAEAPNVQH